MRCSVAVLQFPNRLYESQKLTLYLYINIEVFLGYRNSLERTATLQRCNAATLPAGVDGSQRCNSESKKYRRKMKNFL